MRLYVWWYFCSKFKKRLFCSRLFLFWFCNFFSLCMKFLKTFLWYLKLTEYVRSYRIFKSFNYSRVKLTSIFLYHWMLKIPNNLSMHAKKMACTQSIYECHGQYSCNGDQQKERKKNSKQLKEIVKVGKLITLIDRQQCSGIHTKIWIFVTPSKMQPSRTIDCHFILCSYISFFIVHLILFHFFAGKLLSSWAFKFVVDVKHKKKKTVVVFRGFFLHFFFCICIRI